MEFLSSFFCLENYCSECFSEKTSGRKFGTSEHVGVRLVAIDDLDSAISPELSSRGRIGGLQGQGSQGRVFACLALLGGKHRAKGRGSLALVLAVLLV